MMIIEAEIEPIAFLGGQTIKAEYVDAYLEWTAGDIEWWWKMVVGPALRAHGLCH